MSELLAGTAGRQQLIIGTCGVAGYAVVGADLWVPKTCATCADVLWVRRQLSRVSGTWLAGPS